MVEVTEDRVLEAIGAIDETLQVLFSDFNYALLRAKLMAEMVIGVIAATELLKQAGVDESRLTRTVCALDDSATTAQPRA